MVFISPTYVLIPVEGINQDDLPSTKDDGFRSQNADFTGNILDFLNLGVWNGAGISQDNSLIGTVQESQHRDLGGSLF